MKRIAATLCALWLAVSAMPQAGAGASGQAPGQGGTSVSLPRVRREPWRFQVRHADPWAIVALMQGVPIVSPELSTIMRGLGFPQQAAQAANSLVEGGHLMVNPTDNSIWFIPD